jgi:hypothetical protein
MVATAQADCRQYEKSNKVKERPSPIAGKFLGAMARCIAAP